MLFRARQRHPRPRFGLPHASIVVGLLVLGTPPAAGESIDTSCQLDWWVHDSDISATVTAPSSPAIVLPLRWEHYRGTNRPTVEAPYVAVDARDPSDAPVAGTLSLFPERDNVAASGQHAPPQLVLWRPEAPLTVGAHVLHVTVAGPPDAGHRRGSCPFDGVELTVVVDVIGDVTSGVELALEGEVTHREHLVPLYEPAHCDDPDVLPCPATPGACYWRRLLTLRSDHVSFQVTGFGARDRVNFAYRASADGEPRAWEYFRHGQDTGSRSFGVTIEGVVEPVTEPLCYEVELYDVLYGEIVHTRTLCSDPEQHDVDHAIPEIPGITDVMIAAACGEGGSSPQQDAVDGPDAVDAVPQDVEGSDAHADPSPPGSANGAGSGDGCRGAPAPATPLALVVLAILGLVATRRRWPLSRAPSGGSPGPGPRR